MQRPINADVDGSTSSIDCNTNSTAEKEGKTHTHTHTASRGWTNDYESIVPLANSWENLSVLIGVRRPGPTADKCPAAPQENLLLMTCALLYKRPNRCGAFADIYLNY